MIPAHTSGTVHTIICQHAGLTGSSRFTNATRPLGLHLLQLAQLAHLPQHLTPEAIWIASAHREDELGQGVTGDEKLLDASTWSCAPNRTGRESRVLSRQVLAPQPPLTGSSGVPAYRRSRRG